MSIKNNAYVSRFLSHLNKFIEEHNLFSKTEPLFIATSAGVDSLTLLNCVLELRRFGYSNNVTLIHINHGTRDGQLDEEKLVRKIAKLYNCKIEVITFSDLRVTGNFEKLARDKRYRVFKEIAGTAKILLAHHIDDSFEWSLMQQLRSSSFKACLGIPLINGSIRRPFMCFTKKQIQNYARYLNVEFIDDPTNLDIKYERNFFRHEIIPALCKRHPQYLSHYVNRQNALASKLGFHVAKNGPCPIVFSEQTSARILLSDNYSKQELRNILTDLIHQYSSVSRGSLTSQLDKTMMAIKNNKQGPLKFPGDLLLYISHHQLLLVTTKFRIGGWESSFYSKTREYCLADFQLIIDKIKTSSVGNNGFPYWVAISKNDASWLSCQKRDYPLWPTLKATVADTNIVLITALSLTRQWGRSKNHHRRLTLHFLFSV